MYLAKCCTIKVLLITALALLVLLIGVIVLGFVGFPAIVDSELHKAVQLQNDTIQWDRFKKLPVDFDIKVHLFHVNNPDEVQNKGDLPNVTERGPYFYSQSYERVITNLDNGDDAVTYRTIRKLTFNQEKSAPLNSSDRVTVINPILIVILQLTSPLERLFVYGCLNMILPPEYNKLFLETDVETLLFGGLVFARETDVSSASCNVVRKLVIERATPIKCVDSTLNENGTVKELRFSAFNFRHTKSEGIFTINRGIKDVGQLGNIIKWNGKEELPFWGTPLSANNETCNRVRGTDATVYPPGVEKNKELEIYTSDICRVMSVGYNGTRKYKGLDGYVYGVGPNTFRTVYSDPEKDCYCIKVSSDATGVPSCFLDGIMDLSPCFNAPLYLSWPYFLYADEYRNGVIGLPEPDPDEHKTYVLIEPNTGTPLEGYKRVQFNFVIRPVPLMPMSQNYPRTVIPLLWLDEGVRLPQDLVDELENKYYGKLRLVKGAKYGLIAVSAAFFCVTVVFLLRKKYCTKK